MAQRRTRMRAAACALGVTTVLAGCGSPGAGDASGDCSLQIRTAGVVYTSYGYTDRVATKHATAEEASCEDVGRDPAGSVFSDDARSVVTWTFDGYPPGDVLGVRFDAHSFAVYVAESVGPDERDRIYEELSAPSQASKARTNRS